MDLNSHRLHMTSCSSWVVGIGLSFLGRACLFESRHFWLCKGRGVESRHLWRSKGRGV